MILIILLMGLCATYTYLFTFINDNLYLLPVWIIVSILLTLITLLFFIYCIFLPIFKKLSPTNKFKHFAAHQVMTLLVLCTRTSYKVINKEKLVKKSTDPLVIVGNHKSLLDGPWYYCLLKRPVSVVAKDTLLTNPFYRPIMKAFNVICIDRNNDRKAAKSIIEGTNLIKKGLPLMIFPEGGIKTRETEQMVSLRAGAYKLATRAQATIQPIAIHNSTKVSKRIPLLSWTKVKLIVLDPIKYEEYEHMSTTELGLEIAKRVNSTFNEELVEVEVL